MIEPGLDMATGNRVHAISERKDDLYQTPPAAVRAAFQVIAWRTGLTLEWLEGAEKIHEAKKRKRAAVE